MKKKSLTVNAFLNSIRSVLGVVFPLITFPYVSRVLSVEGIGKYNFSYSVTYYFLLIAGLGISTYAIREGAKYRDNKKKLQQFANEMLTINAWSTLLAYLLLFTCLLIFVKLHSYLACILIYSLQIGFTFIGVEWLFTIYEDFLYITIRSIFFQIISLILLFVFVRNSNDYSKYAAITVFSSVGSNYLNFIRARKLLRIHLIWKFNWRIHMIPILILFASNIANFIYVNSDITILGLMKNNYIVGTYTISSKIYSIVKTVISAGLSVTVPRLALLYGKKRMREYQLTLNNLVNSLLLLTLPVMTGLIMLSKEVILIVSGPHFIRSVTSLRILTLSYLFSILAWILNDCVLIPSKQEKKVLVSTTLSAVLNIIFNIALIPYLDENAAAISTLLAELCMFIVNYHFSRKMVRQIFMSKTFFKNFIESILGCIGIVAVCLLCLSSLKSLFIVTILSVMLSIIVYVFVLILMRNSIVLTLIEKLRQ